MHRFLKGQTPADGMDRHRLKNGLEIAPLATDVPDKSACCQ